MKDFYATLDLSSDATQEQIKEQWRFLVHAWHPDKFPNPQQKTKAEEKVKEINEAYEILGNPMKRAQYDRERGSSWFKEDVRSQEKARAEAERQRAEQERQRKQEAEEKQRYAEYQHQQRQRAEEERQRKEQEQRQRDYAEAGQRRAEKERQHKLQRLKRIAFITCIVIFIGSFILYFTHLRIVEGHYQAGISAMNAKQWDDARAEFATIKDYKDASTLYLETYYQQGLDNYKHGQYKDAVNIFIQLMELNNGYKDTSSLLEQSYFKLAEDAKQTVQKAFRGYMEDNSNLVSSLMTAEGQNNATSYCSGKAIICLKNNYSHAGTLLELTTTLTSASGSSADVQLETNWSTRGKLCQDYQLDYENGMWGITFFNVPHSCN
jgi:tetratricopeptide (TPR) repeat protein